MRASDACRDNHIKYNLPAAEGKAALSQDSGAHFAPASGPAPPFPPARSPGRPSDPTPPYTPRFVPQYTPQRPASAMKKPSGSKRSKRRASLRSAPLHCSRSKERSSRLSRSPAVSPNTPGLDIKEDRICAWATGRDEDGKRERRGTLGHCYVGTGKRISRHRGKSNPPRLAPPNLGSWEAFVGFARLPVFARGCVRWPARASGDSPPGNPTGRGGLREYPLLRGPSPRPRGGRRGALGGIGRGRLLRVALPGDRRAPAPRWPRRSSCPPL